MYEELANVFRVEACNVGGPMQGALLRIADALVGLAKPETPSVLAREPEPADLKDVDTAIVSVSDELEIED